MIVIHPRRVLPALLLALATAGCSGATTAARPEAAAPETTRPVATAGAAEIEALYRARQDSARARFTEADARFMTDMIHHHGQAVEMARLVPTHAASQSIRTLAARILNAQMDEIAIMQTWLRDRGRPVPELHIMGAQVMVHGADHAEHDMPGMLTAEQLQSLHRARGAAFDRLFLELMIQHHRGAVVMVHDLFATDGAALDEVVFRFASDVQVDQSTEVARMELMLSAMPDTGSDL